MRHRKHEVHEICVFGVFLLRETMKRDCLSTFSSDRWCESTLLRRFAHRGPSGSFGGFNANLGVFEKFAFLKSRLLNRPHSMQNTRQFGAKALSWKMTPRFQRKLVNFRFFRSLEVRKSSFGAISRGGTRSKLSFSFSEMPLISKSVQEMIVQINFGNSKKW